MWLYLTMSQQNIIAKSTRIVKQSSCPEWHVATSTTVPYGMTSNHLVEKDCVDSSTLLSAGSRNYARISALQDMEKAWKESEADYFSRSCAWPKKSSPNSYFLKTCQQSPAVADFKLLERLPKWGMIVGGVLYPLRPLERYTSAKGGSYWPTPCAQESGRGYESHMKMKKEMGRKTCTSLSAAIQMWPTPDSSARGARTNQNGHHFTIQDAVGSGKLNPTWVEWLMGYPKEHTVLEPWAMQWFLAKRKKRSKS